jgi:Na+-translocating ferredoxin:NAD+ oxidoreductase RnfG subunit
MKKFKLPTVPAIVAICLLAVVFNSCQNEKEQVKETKQEYIQRVFFEQTIKQQYYTKMFLNAAEKLDLKTMQLYKDSASMARYCSHNAYVEMQFLNNR